jgi:hypothetical protein
LSRSCAVDSFVPQVMASSFTARWIGVRREVEGVRLLVNVRPGSSTFDAMETRSLAPALLLAVVALMVALTVMVMWNSLPDFTAPATVISAY